ncbi:MAG: HEAT repeat domain-containing protein [Clostridia bacterium]|nr:HEAT repeat domain-containing protein [Clostridia bacterium]
MKCIDFDKAFSLFAMKWFKDHAKEYKNYDAMEAAMPEVYDRFLDAPADFLAGAKPGEYFRQWDDAKTLIDWMEDYFKQKVPVPDMLLNRITELGEPAEKRLYNLLQKERTPQEARMTAVSLLGEMGSTLPMQLYISWQLNRAYEDELCDAACEALAQMGEEAIDPMLAFLDDANDAGKEALCSVLSYYPDTSGKVLPELLRLIRKPDANVAVLAGYLGRLGEEGALETLIDLALDEDLTYLNYIELRSAIEQLGGDAPEREFDESDPDYEAMQSLQMSPWPKNDETPDDGDYLQ